MAFPTPSPAERCARHPDAAAGWRCKHCGSRLCPACVGTRRAGPTEYEVCCLCSGAVEQLRIRRSSLSYLDLLLKGAWRYPLSRNGLLSLGAAGLFFFLVPGGLLGLAIKVGVLFTYLFALVQQLSNGVDHIEPPDFTDIFELGAGVVRGLLAVSFFVVPAAVLIYKAAYGGVDAAMEAPAAVHARPAASLPGVDRRARPSVDPDDELMPSDLGSARDAPEPERAAAEGKELWQLLRPLAAGSSLPWLLFALVGLVLTPMALLLAATASSPLTILNPVGLFALIRRIPGDYAVALGALLGLGIVESAVTLVAGLLTSVRIPVVPSVLANTLLLYVPFVGAYVLGALLWSRGAELGCLHEAEAYIPALPGAVPRGVPPPTPEEQAGMKRPSAISLEESGSIPALASSSRRPNVVSLAESMSALAQAPAYQRPDAISLPSIPAYVPPLDPGAVSPEQSGSIPALAAPERPGASSPGKRGTLPALPRVPRPGPVSLEQSGTLPGLPPAVRPSRESASDDDSAAPEATTALLPAVRPGPPDAEVTEPQGAARAPRLVLRGERAQLFEQPRGDDEKTEVRPTPVSAAVRVQRALKANRLENAMSAYRSADLSAQDLSGPEHFRVGIAAAEHGDYPLACKAFQAAAAVDFNDALAPTALVMAGRMLGEHMQEPALAARLFQQVIQHYPDSEGARQARERLAAARG